jgi:hypothetical protein
VGDIGTRFTGVVGKGNLQEIPAQRRPSGASVKICRFADEQIHTDPVVHHDDVDPLRIVRVAVALQIGERRVPADRQVADRRLLASDEWPVLQGDLLQRDGRLLVEPADMRLREQLHKLRSS